MSSSLLTSMIREILLTESYNVTIRGKPISTGEPKKRGEEDPPSLFANVVLSHDDLTSIISNMNDRDVMNNTSGESDQTVMSRIRAIKERVSETAAKLAASIYMSIKDDPAIIKSVFFNMPDVDGVAVIADPIIGKTYDIPTVFHQLALEDKYAGGDENIGKGEALGILMFGRMGDSKEPDLVVDTDNVEFQFSCKFFRSRSDTVRFSAGLKDKEASTKRIIELTQDLRDLANRTDTRIGRSKMNEILTILDLNYVEDEGLPSRQVVDKMIEECSQLWNNLKVSPYPVLALVGGPFRFEVASADPKSSDGIRLGVIRFDGNIPKIEIASPFVSRIDVGIN